MLVGAGLLDSLPGRQLVVYGLCAASLFRQASRPRDRVVAVLGGAFSLAAVARRSAPLDPAHCRLHYCHQPGLAMDSRRRARDVDAAAGAD